MRDVRERPVPDPRDVPLTTVMHALSDLTRLDVARRLLENGETACADFDLPFSKATCSYHFRVLRDAGLISTRMVGKHQYAALRHDDLERWWPGLLDLVRVSDRRRRTAG